MRTILKTLIVTGFLCQITIPFYSYAVPTTVSVENPPIVRNINIELRDVFEGEDLASFYRAANKIKINTRKDVIKRELLFKEGDSYDQFKVDESERVLRTLRYIHKVKITPKFDGDFVDLNVSVQDTWTLIPYLAYSSGSGSTNNKAIGLTESNLLGYGKRAEVLFRDKDNRTSVEGVWEDNRVWGSQTNLLLGYFNRSDGDRYISSLGVPYRNLESKKAWGFEFDIADTIGRLFDRGEERFIFGQRKNDIKGFYSFSEGDPKKLLHRYSFGYELNDYEFDPATASDYDDANVDPSEVVNDPTLLPRDRKFSYPFFSYRRIVPDFVSHNYVDRFERVEDFNLGNVFDGKIGYSPTFLGSDDNAWIISLNDADGFSISKNSFLRGEIGLAGRYQGRDLENGLLRAEVKFVYLLGPKFIGEKFIGNHTLVASSILNYGYKLDGEREFYAGGSTGLRGYDSKTFFGDKSFIFNIEDRFHLVDDILKLVSLGGAVFVDVGGATGDSLGTVFSDKLYGDFGVGLRLGFPRSSGGRVLRLDLAFPFRDGPDGTESYEIRLVLEGGQLFEALMESERFGADKVNVDAGFSD